MKSISSILLSLLITVFLIACHSTDPLYHAEKAKAWETRTLPSTSNNPLVHRAFLIGDAGLPQTNGKDPVLNLLQRKLAAAGEASSVTFLGDNIYPKGLPDEEDSSYVEAKSYLDAQLNILANYPGKVIFLPGNHDYAKSGKGGHKAVLRQEKYVESVLNAGNTFMPDDGCPGPDVVKLAEGVVMVVINSEWWLMNDSDRKTKGCEIKTELEFITELEGILKDHLHDRILVVAHHPIKSLGKHGGHFPVKEHLFPLRLVNEKLYIPFPIIGSLYPYYRKFLGHPQDIIHPRYQLYIDNLLETFDDRSLVYASGHEHNLQYFEEDNLDVIVSGSGSKKSHMARRKSAVFGHEEKGFSELRYHANGEVWMIFWEADANNPDGKEVYRHQLEPANPLLAEKRGNKQTYDTSRDYSDSTVTVVPSNLYQAGALKRVFFGEHYRDTWLTPIEVPVLNIHKVHGGLVPIKKGGGQQTKSLRLQGGNGKQYVFRSIEKYPINAIPKLLRKTIAAEIVQDQISMAHPYGAVLVPSLADAGNVYHTNPQVVVVPDDPILGEYREEFAGMLVIFEERPQGNQEEMASFGNAKKLIGSPDLYEKVLEDHDHKVDDIWLLRSRLFDMFLNDWDRHEDQWRWSRFKMGDSTLYRPVPRDRDQVFIKFRGLLPSLANRKWGIRKFQSFDHDIRDISGMNFNARYVDRNFLTEPSMEAWIKEAKDLQANLTDEVIEKAIRQLPKAAFDLEGETIIAKLKSRRDNLQKFARDYYLVLAREVEILGSDKREIFEIKRLNDESTEVTVYDMKGKGNKGEVLYHRLFLTSETREIRIFGHGGHDKFLLTGDVKKGIIVRIIGGKGKDEIINESNVRGWLKKTKVYDRKKNTAFEAESDTRDYRTDRDPDINEYDRRSFVYNYLGPLAFFGFNKDDGVYLGGGFLIRKYGFQRSPYKYEQSLKANVALGTGAFNARYRGDFRRAIGRYDLLTEGTSFFPSSVTNYFGLGNETTSNDDVEIDFNRIRLRQIEIFQAIKRVSKDERHQFVLGPEFQYFDLERVLDRFISTPASGLGRNDFTPKYYLGGKTRYRYDHVDHGANPTRGVRFEALAAWKQNLQETGDNFFKLQSELSFYLTLHSLPTRPTLAFRTGAATNIGEYEFFQANVLGGTANLGQQQQMRGLRRNRFAGTSAVYQNVEARLRLVNLETYLVPVTIGLLGFYDVGRVWLESETSDIWHNSTGGGVWLSPLDVVVVTATYSVSDVDEVFNLKFGFLF